MYSVAVRTGLQWCNVNNSLIQYKNRYAPMQSGIYGVTGLFVICRIYSRDFTHRKKPVEKTIK